MGPLWIEPGGTLSQAEASFLPRRKGLRIQCKTEGLAPRSFQWPGLYCKGFASSFPNSGRWERKHSTIVPLAQEVFTQILRHELLGGLQQRDCTPMHDSTSLAGSRPDRAPFLVGLRRNYPQFLQSGRTPPSPGQKEEAFQPCPASEAGKARSTVAGEGGCTFWEATHN